MAYHAFTTAPYREEDGSGVTIAVAIVLRLPGPVRSAIDVERWVHEIDRRIRRVFGADEDTPVGMAIRATERTDKQTASNLILDAAVDCSTNFERARGERPTRTIADFDMPRGGITN